MRRIGIVLAASSIAVVCTAVPAFAAKPSTVKAVTHLSQHYDTTSVSGPCAKEAFDAAGGDRGPAWAYDNLSLQFVATPDGTNSWSVTITANGSFDAFSNPVTGDCYTGHGSVTGTITYEVSSPTAPSAANLPAQSADPTSQSELVNTFFGGNANITASSNYHYTYNKVAGQVYSQP